MTSVKDEDDLIVMTKAGKVIRTPVNKIKVLSRPAKGVKIISLAEKDKVCAIACIKEEI